ncbi:MAG TPA: alpha-galactosidase [Tessaracoccus flavescens]|uniref:alpha-galactosidase n=1 Tax=Tessaracoccus flavescens TaxID=399497 RepID=A0A921EQC8_9ACTN|nr:alpha-galactosidase [Tessaracoccus flavescens]
MPELPITLHLNRGGTSAVLHVTADGVPHLAHWGESLGELSEEQLDALVAAQIPPVVSGSADMPPTMALVPLQSDGWLGTPGLVGSRRGRGLFPAFRPVAVRAEDDAIAVDLHDDEAELDLTLELELTDAGLLRCRAILTNAGEGGYDLESLVLALPTPAAETRVIDQTGRHLRERDIQTHEFTIGSHERTVRVARAHSASAIHGTCAEGAGWRSGLVHYIHVAWSGNIVSKAERDTLGFQGLLGGELLYPGEITLDHGESYETPWIIATWGDGLDAAAARIHAYIRGFANYPATLRPVTLNAWEAVYFDHSLPRLLKIVDAAAAIGVERFVLDDGWFGSRRDDTSGLGDWVISPEVWPDGITPLADAVHAHGMQFGLWVEPEMINPDSDAARAHPEWILSPATHQPRLARHQQVIDLTNPEAFEHVRSQLIAVLDSTPIDYLKWDFNRDLYEAVSPRTGLPAYHAQTHAAYALIDALLEHQPGLEIESCAGGGGRVDLEIMRRTVRVWGSDCIDPLERKLIEAGTALLLPPELVGSHVASPTSHTTGRTQELGFRASNALFSHMGIEWDLTKASEADRAELGAWVALHKRLRPFLHSGTTVHADHPDRSWWVHGVVGEDRAIYALTRMATGAVRPTPPLCLPGLDPDTVYLVRELLPDGVASPASGHHFPMVPWWENGLTLTGRALATAGLRFPDLNPEQTILLEARVVG